MPRLKSSDENVFGGQWSLNKLNCVSRYLEAYLNVLKEQKWAELWYIDAFCGNGFQGIKDPYSTRLDEETAFVDFIEGSAVRALKLASDFDKQHRKTFDHFVFIEYDFVKIKSLEENVRRLFPEQFSKCEFVQGDVNSALPKCLRSINWGTGRAVTFLDPCSTQLRWTTMEAFSGTKSDVWCLFPIEAIMRMLPTDHIPDDSWAKRLDVVFGDSLWREIYFQPNLNQLDLFGGVDERFIRDKGIEQVVSYVIDRYKTIFPCVMEPGILRGTNNHPLFALFALVANQSEAAIKRARAIAGHLLKGINDGSC